MVPDITYRKHMPFSQTALDMVRLFEVSPNIYPENIFPVHKRWANIMIDLPATRGRRLSDDMTDVFQAAEASTNAITVLMARDLAVLQFRLYNILHASGLIPTRVFYAAREYSLYWQQRFIDRGNDTYVDRRMDYRIRKAKRVPVAQPTWVH